MAILYLQENLKGEYREVYEKVEIYSLTTRMSESETDELMMNLLDSLMTAQEKGEPVEKVLGTDIEEFCRDYFVVNHNMNERIKNAIENIYHFVWIVFVLEIVTMFSDLGEGISAGEMKTDISPYLFGFAIGGLVAVLNILLVRPIVLKKRKVNSTAYSVILLTVTLFMVIGSMILWGDKKLIELPSLLILWITGIILFGYITIRAIYQYRKTGSIRKEKNLSKEAQREAEKEAERMQLKRSFAEGLRNDMPG